MSEAVKDIESAIEDEDEVPSEYELGTPIEWDGDAISEIKLTPNGRVMKGFVHDFSAAGGVIRGDTYKYAELGLKLAGLPRVIVDRMTPHDQFGLATVVLGFTTAGPRTGRKPSP